APRRRARRRRAPPARRSRAPRSRPPTAGRGSGSCCDAWSCRPRASRTCSAWRPGSSAPCTATTSSTAGLRPHRRAAAAVQVPDGPRLRGRQRQERGRSSRRANPSRPAQLRRLVASLPATVVGGTPPSEACTICLQAPQQDEVLVTLPCGHWYHSDCIREWLGVARLCPLCKGSVVSQDAD
ncbi:unnamed protein product, partial [Prorocentrum cordatum]